MSMGNTTFVMPAFGAADEMAESNDCEVFEFVASTLIIIVLSTIGMCGNLTSIVVFCKYRTETSTMFLLRCLACADLALVFFAMFIYSFTPVYPFAEVDDTTRRVYNSIRLHVWPLTMIAHTCTVWFTVLVTATRYCAISQVGKMAKRHKHRRYQVQVLLFFTLSVLYNIPRFFEHHSFGTCAQDIPGSANTTLIGRDQQCLLGDNKVYQIVYCNVLYFAVMYVIPLVTLTYFTAHLVRFLKTFRLRKAYRSASRRREDHITLCIVSIVFVFIFCQTPALVNQIFWAAMSSSDRECGRFHYYYTRISDILVVLNSSVNFFIYCLFGAKFRKIFIQALCKSSEQTIQKARLFM